MTKSKEVRALQVGERCRVYEGPCVVDGEVIHLPEASFPGAVNVLLDPDSDGHVHKQMFHRRQCARLIKKPRPKPQERVGFRRHKWLNVFADSEYFLDSADEAKKWADSRNFIRTVHLVELAPGEVVVSRDDLARAWAEIWVIHRTTIPQELFNPLCAALGLSEAK